jgi:hypothetical protein
MFWITDFRDYGISLLFLPIRCFGFEVLAVGFWIRIYRIYRIIEDVFGLNLRVICRDAMLRVFSLTGSMLYFPQSMFLNHGFYGLMDCTVFGVRFQPQSWIRIYRIFRIKEDVFVLNLRVICRDAMLRVFFQTGFNGIFPSIKYSESRILRIMGFHCCFCRYVVLVLRCAFSLSLESGFTRFLGLQRTSSV